MHINPRSSWTSEPFGFAKYPERRIKPERVTFTALHWPGDKGRDYGLLTVEQIVSMIRRIRTYHTEFRGWADIGYPFVVDMRGGIWEAAGKEFAAAHSSSDAYPMANAEGQAILLLIGENEEPSAEMVASALWLLDYLHGVFPNMGKVLGHNQVKGAATTCPGPFVQAAIDEGVFDMATFVSPAKGRLTSRYGPRERHPVTGVAGFHKGDDIAPTVPGARGEPLYAPMSGRIRLVVTGRPRGDKRPNPLTGTWNTGNCIVLDSDYGPTFFMGHPEMVYVAAGQRVRAGDVVGTMGDSGNVTGVHLHLEVWANKYHNSHYNPMVLFNRFGVAPGSAPVIPKNPTGLDWLDMATDKEVRDIVREELNRKFQNDVESIKVAVGRLDVGAGRSLLDELLKTRHEVQTIKPAIGRVDPGTGKDLLAEIITALSDLPYIRAEFDKIKPAIGRTDPGAGRTLLGEIRKIVKGG